MIPREILAALRTIEIHTARLANEQLSGTYKSSFKGQGAPTTPVTTRGGSTGTSRRA